MKRLFAMMLAASLCLSLCVPAFAAEGTLSEEKVQGVIDEYERQRIDEQLIIQDNIVVTLFPESNPFV